MSTERKANAPEALDYRGLSQRRRKTLASRIPVFICLVVSVLLGLCGLVLLLAMPVMVNGGIFGPINAIIFACVVLASVFLLLLARWLDRPPAG